MKCPFCADQEQDEYVKGYAYIAIIFYLEPVIKTNAA